MTPEHLATIRARAAAATEGPWEAGLAMKVLTVWDVPFQMTVGWAGDDDDRAFIAHARADIPDLLDALDRALARIAELERGAEGDGR